MNSGMSIFIGVVLFNMILYCVVLTANSDAQFSTIGNTDSMNSTISGSIDTDDTLSITDATSWLDGFNISVFGLPWWVNIFYVTFQAVLIVLALYALIRGLS